MKSKVTLRERVGTNIVYAVLLVLYYWMWARRDWQSYYETIQNVVVMFTVIFFALQAYRIWKHSKEDKDELAVRNLHRADSISLKIMTASAIVIAFAGAVGAVDGSMAGYALVGSILALAVARFIIFCIMDSKGV